MIALYTEPERQAMFVRQADEAVCLGPARVGADGRAAAATSTTARSSARWSPPRADAVWVGWGFVAEDPAFAELCERLGIVFVGPERRRDAPRRRQDRRQAARRGRRRAGRAVERRARSTDRRGGAAPRRRGSASR